MVTGWLSVCALCFVSATVFHGPGETLFFDIVCKWADVYSPWPYITLVWPLYAVLPTVSSLEAN